MCIYMFQIKYNGGINLVNEGLVLKNCMFEILVSKYMSFRCFVTYKDCNYSEGEVVLISLLLTYF